MGSSGSRVDTWLRWIEGPIKNDVLTMHLHRSTFQKITRMAERADLPDSYFWEYLRDTYATTQAVAIRRQVDAGPRVHTLARLVDEVSASAETLTRDWWIALWGDNDDGSWTHEAARGFDDQFGGAVGEHFDPAIASADIAEMAEKAKMVKRYVNEHVAHADRNPAKDMPTFNDLDAAIDAIGEMFKKYANLLTAATYPILVPAHQYDWLAPFRVPWLPPAR